MFKQQYQQGYLALFIFTVISLVIIPAASEIIEDVQNYNNGYIEAKDGAQN